MMEFILWLIFIKTVSEAVKRLKNIVIIEKDYNDWKLLWWFEIVIIIQKYYDDLKVL